MSLLDETPYLYHGTTVSNLDGILEEGLLPEKTKGILDHVCLSSDIHQALFFGRLSNIQLGSGYINRDYRTVLIRIPTCSLDRTQFCSETGSYRLSAYGHMRSDRQHIDLKPLLDDPEGFLRATDAIGYKQRVQVTPDMIDWRFTSIRTVGMQEALNELRYGVAPDDIQEILAADMYPTAMAA